MTVPRSVAQVLTDDVTLEVECIDRRYLSLYVPSLQYETNVVGFFTGHRGATFGPSALMDPMTKHFVKASAWPTHPHSQERFPPKRRRSPNRRARRRRSG